MENHPEKMAEEKRMPKSDHEEFSPPRHWIGPEELEATYWNNPKNQEKRAQEFFEKPIEYLEKMDRSPEGGIARRDFLTVMGASMAMASFACARRPVQKIIPYVVKPEEITPGVPNWYASTCNECASGCGTLVKTREGRPIKLEGNPDHPINRGALCARGQASVLGLYDPDRLTKPVRRSRGSQGPAMDTTWQEADAYVIEKLKAASGRVRVLSGELSSETQKRLIREFLSTFKSNDSAHVSYSPLGLEELSDAQALSYGSAVTPAYYFDRADLIVSLGADFLGTWVSPVEHSQMWSKKRKLHNQTPSSATLSKMVCFEPTMTLTGSNADERYAVRPGDELKVAMALIQALVSQGASLQGVATPAFLEALKGYSPDQVANEIGIQGGGQTLKALATELWKNRGKSLIVAGSIQSKNQNALALQVAVNLLNSILGNEGTTVAGNAGEGPAQKGFSEMSRLIADMAAGQVDVLVIYRSNPAYTLPIAAGFQEALKKVGTVISIADRDDETGLLADFVLPDHHSLENWGDANPRKGLYSLQQPTIAPMYSTRAFEDSLLAWSKPGQNLDWHAYLQNYWKENHYKGNGSLSTFQQFWDGVLRAGVYDANAARGIQARPSARKFKSESLKVIPAYVERKGALVLALYPKMSMYDGSGANNPWLQEMPDPISTVTWDNYLNVGPGMAKKLGLNNDDVVEVRSLGVSVELPVFVQPGMHSEVVSAAVGYGRRSVGKVGNQAGVDVYPMTRAQDAQMIFSGNEVEIRKTGKYYKLASTQWHGASENRPVINDITLAQFKKNPATANHTDPHLRLETVPSLWPEHKYTGYKWGMTIDLNSCTGCGACVIACQAENNVPVVGRDQVRVSRQMHWLRIDRYYAGDVEKPDVIFQPMLCQHCDNAPCETVCPVVATVHDDEGLNLQVYNRCVGTRYCQNNCPYKVRRFNFFDNWKAYEGPMNMVWNPDVTVRTRGIMEKCTFCTQRIREAKEKAKDAGPKEKVKDGDLVTACQQTCPTQAIAFGDLNDPNSQVSKMGASPQAFRVLEVLNAKPSISYMTKVRNKDASAGGHENGAHKA